MTTTQKSIIHSTQEFVQTELSKAEGGHDWWHVYRVWNLSQQIAATETVDLFVVELGALLHDIADSKFHKGDEKIGPQKAREFLSSLGVEEKVIVHVENIISNISFKGGNHPQKFRSRELDIVQDADRLDALGAIGIARTFNYGGYKGREIYNPHIRPHLNMTKEEYKHSNAPTLNHFYEKLLLLKDQMNTTAGKSLAEHRHRFMEHYLDEFYKEWNSRSLDIRIQKLDATADPPMDLLLLADPSEELVRSYLGKGTCFIATLYGETVGVILTMKTEPFTQEVMNLAVKEELHNRGIGRKLLLFAIEEIKKGDTQRIEIGTGNPGVVQMLLYQKCGFRIVDVDLDFFRRTHPEPIYENGIECRDMIRMRLDLTKL